MNKYLIEKILDVEIEENKYEFASFLFSIIDGKLYLGQRNTPPNKGLYGPVGGKADSKSEEEDNLFLETIGGHQKQYVSHSISEKLGVEYPNVTAIREFFEEIFYQKKWTEKDVGQIYKLGSLDDKYKNRDIWLNFYLAEINRNDFDLSPREIMDFKPIEELRDEQIYQIAKPALLHIKYLEQHYPKNFWFSKYNLSEQIPELLLTRTEIFKMRPSMAGALSHKPNKKLLMQKLNIF